MGWILNVCLAQTVVILPFGCVGSLRQSNALFSEGCHGAASVWNDDGPLFESATPLLVLDEEPEFSAESSAFRVGEIFTLESFEKSKNLVSCRSPPQASLFIISIVEE